jgi:transposase-like protein
MEKRIEKRYSRAFKQFIVDEYEKGESVMKLRMRYGIGGDHTITRWVSQYGREGVRHKLMRIQHPSEQDQVKELEARMRELEAALAQASVDRLMYESMVKVAEEKYGIDLKKVSAGRSSRRPTAPAGNEGSA